MDQIVAPPSAANSAEQSDFVTAFARGLDVIRALGAEGPPATLTEIARRVDLPRATVRRSLITFEILGLRKDRGKSFRAHTANFVAWLFLFDFESARAGFATLSTEPFQHLERAFRDRNS